MPTLLVVDDSALDRRLAGRLLEKQAGWNVVYATDGNEAMQQLEMHLPDAVLTDLQMPGMNGLELVACVRKEYPLVPVILMTAKGSEEISVQALQQGAASYVPKRLLAQELVEIVDRVLQAAGDDRSQSRLLNRMTRQTCTFVLENDLSLFPPVVSYVQESMTRMRICNDSDRLRVGVVMEEALLNAYYHGNLEVSSKLREEDHNAYYDLAKKRCQEDPYSERRIYIDVTFAPEKAVCVIRDEGPGFDPTKLPDATDPANLERPCGRGLLLIHTFMDEVRFNGTGNEITLVKHRSPVMAESLAGEVSR